MNVQRTIENPPLYVGPFLQFEDTIGDIYKLNVLVVHKVTTEIDLNFQTEHTKAISIISQKHGYNFTRIDVDIPQTDLDKKVIYTLQVTEGDTVSVTTFSFFVPAQNESWKLLFYSCNEISHTTGYSGYSEKVGGILPMWADLMRHHNVHNYHLAIGLGDQIYNDEIFEHVPELSKWTFMRDRIEREKMQCTESLLQKVDEWVMFHYIHHFGQSYFAKALSHIPQLMISSDHDMYDGVFSYPPELQNSPVLLNVTKVLQKYYLLFQCHSKDVLSNDAIGDGVAPFVKQLGSRIAILGLDTRFERTKERIIKPTTYEYIFKQLQNVHKCTKHLIIATEIPLIFPDLRAIERFLESISRIKRKKLFNKLFSWLRTFKFFGFPFGEPLLLTDLVDHWNSVTHINERNDFLHKLQEYSKSRSIRVTFVAGDVHCAGIGKFCTPSNAAEKVRRGYENRMLIPFDAESDYKLMYQIMTSAIANTPPPSYIISAYHILDKSENIQNGSEITHARMLRFFLRSTAGRLFQKSSKKLMGQRNYCTMELSDVDDSLFAVLYVEMFLGAGKTVKYDISIPSLVLSSIM